MINGFMASKGRQREQKNQTNVKPVFNKASSMFREKLK